MKKIMMLLFGMLLLGSVSYSEAGLITWGYSADLNTAGTFTDGWAVRLFEDVSADGFGAGYTIGTDDVWVNAIETTLVTGKQGLYWGLNFNAPGGDLALSDSIYTVIFNNADASLATEYIIVDASPYVLPATDIDATYALSSVSGTWQAVPEPATIVLFGIGLATAGFASRKRKQPNKA